MDVKAQFATLFPGKPIQVIGNGAAVYGVGVFESVFQAAIYVSAVAMVRYSAEKMKKYLRSYHQRYPKMIVKQSGAYCVVAPN